MSAVEASRLHGSMDKGMAKRIFIPGDSVAVALGSDEVAGRFRDLARKRKVEIEIVRNGSRGACHLEPLVEAETPEGRAAWGPVGPDGAEGVFESAVMGAGEGSRHPLYLGLPEEMPYLKGQTRITFKRAGLIDPISIDDYVADGGLAGLRKALGMTPEEIIAEVKASGLRGRGGAAFSTGIKRETALKTESAVKYVVCNADEGDSGSFSDRMLIEGDPFSLIEGMIIASLAVGAQEGYVYLRSEYPYAREAFKKALKAAYGSGLLGKDVMGGKKRFDVHLVTGAGSYVCGEETALLESLENRRGMVRPRPPVPAVSGLFGRPTILNNVITLASVANIFETGSKGYKSLGAGMSAGTLPFQLSGNVKRPGLVEAPFGIGLEELIYGFGGGTASGRPVKAVQIGGPLGAYFPSSAVKEIRLTYEDLASRGGMLGHGGIVVFDDRADMADLARRSLEFAGIESCGKCTPCRLGSMRSHEFLERIMEGDNAPANRAVLREIFAASANLSLCGLGGMMHLPVESLMRHFPGEFGLK